MNNIYKYFILNKIDFLTFLESALLLFLLLLICSLFFSVYNILSVQKKNNIELEKLIKYEKNLINLKELYNNGQINAKKYRERVNNLKSNLRYRNGFK